MSLLEILVLNQATTQQLTTNQPTNQPTSKQPTNQQASKQPTNQQASNQPTNQPTSKQPTNKQASKQASKQPTNQPTNQLTNQPTFSGKLALYTRSTFEPYFKRGSFNCGRLFIVYGGLSVSSTRLDKKKSNVGEDTHSHVLTGLK